MKIEDMKCGRGAIIKSAGEKGIVVDPIRLAREIRAFNGNLGIYPIEGTNMIGMYDKNKAMTIDGIEHLAGPMIILHKENGEVSCLDRGEMYGALVELSEREIEIKLGTGENFKVYELY